MMTMCYHRQSRHCTIRVGRSFSYEVDDVNQKQRSSFKAFYISFFVFLTLSASVWGMLQAWLRHEENVIKMNGYALANNLSIAFEEHVSSVIANADGLLKDIREDVISNQPELRRIVQEELGTYGAYVSQLSILDKDGILIFSSPGPTNTKVDLKDRKHFQIHKLHPHDDIIYVSQPVLGKVSKVWSIQITRPVLKHGEFAGVLVLSIPAKYFTDFFNKIDVGERGLISIIGFDGQPRVLASRQKVGFDEYSATAKANSSWLGSVTGNNGYYQGSGLLSRRPSLTAFRRLDSAQLTVLVELSEEDLFSSFHQTRKHFLLFASMITILIAMLSAFIYNWIRLTTKKTEYLKKANHELTNRITTDFLTQVRSRGKFHDELQAAANKAQEGQLGLCLLMLDLDNFKSINDNYGHPVGDLVLKKIASLCKEPLRKNDIIGRLGGEEFGIILQNLDLLEAEQIAKKICIRVRNTQIPTPKGNIKVTVSIGAAAFDSSNKTPDELIRRADEALYESKRAGRNRVTSAP